MIKAVMSYEDENELLSLVKLFRPYITRIKPVLNKPPSKGTKSGYLRRYIWLKIPHTNTGNPHKQAENT